MEHDASFETREEASAVNTSHENAHTPFLFMAFTFVLYGTISTLLSKAFYQTPAAGVAPNSTHVFAKPLFLNALTFVGMTLCLFFRNMRPLEHRVIRKLSRSSSVFSDDNEAAGRVEVFGIVLSGAAPPSEDSDDDDDAATSAASESTPLIAGRVGGGRGRGSASTIESRLSAVSSSSSSSSFTHASQQFRVRHLHKIAQYRLFAFALVPAVFDFFSGYMLNVALLWLDASAWQMLHGSTLVFGAAVRLAWLRTSLRSYEWIGVLLVLCSLLCLYIVVVEREADTEYHPTTAYHDQQKYTGFWLVLGAELLGAVQLVVEEWLMFDVAATDMEIVGYEGVWGVLLCVLASPLVALDWWPVTLTTTSETTVGVGVVVREVWADTRAMLSADVWLRVMSCAYVLLVFGYTIIGIRLAMNLNALARNILDQTRVVCVWLVAVAIHYVITSRYGERWDAWASMAQGLSFVVMLLGVSVYSTVIMLPFLTYFDAVVADDDDDDDDLFLDDSGLYGHDRTRGVVDDDAEDEDEDGYGSTARGTGLAASHR